MWPAKGMRPSARTTGEFASSATLAVLGGLARMARSRADACCRVESLLNARDSATQHSEKSERHDDSPHCSSQPERRSIEAATRLTAVLVAFACEPRSDINTMSCGFLAKLGHERLRDRLRHQFFERLQFSSFLRSAHRFARGVPGAPDKRWSMRRPRQSPRVATCVTASVTIGSEPDEWDATGRAGDERPYPA
jgi:hypothetical protein